MRNIKDIILLDCKRYGSEKLLKEFFTNRGFRYTVFMRYYSRSNKIVRFIINIIKKIIFHGSCIEVSLGIECGSGLYLGHFSGVTINNKVIIGNNVNIHKGVTIGQENRGKRKGVPTIGDYVWIGVNSTLVGKIKVGNNVLIAPNNFINFDIPDNSIVVNGKVIKKENATEGYITNAI